MTATEGDPMTATTGSNLVDHAIRELAAAGIEEDVRPSLIAAVAAFASYGHSGGSAAVTTDILHRLLTFRNVAPLTSNPDEWAHVGGLVGREVWQNNRNSEAFSEDGGKTYRLLSERRRWVPWRLRQTRIGGRIYDGPKHTAAEVSR